MSTDELAYDQPQKARVVLAEVSRMVAQAFQEMIISDRSMSVAAVAHDQESALRYVNGHKPHVLILEVPGIIAPDGLAEMVDRIKPLSPQTGILLLCDDPSPEIASYGFAAGIQNYVSKSEPAVRLFKAMHRVSTRGSYFCPAMVNAMVAHHQTGKQNLTPRELQVLQMVGYGYTNGEIGEELYLSVRTVESHRATLQEKLDKSSRRELVREAIDRGLLR